LTASETRGRDPWDSQLHDCTTPSLVFSFGKHDYTSPENETAACSDSFAPPPQPSFSL
ncbi:hypothetical protein BHE74_00037317, partial [Ensete ventricosum]